ncbi:MAG TPA: pyridoxal-phosphate dependent enzyme [Opitutaceae bacterium]|nr:pyridoxal-phosphate dependent enzyme [Opitutaceae bacterium]
MTAAPQIADIRAAHARIKPHIRQTPVLTSALLDRETGARLFFKCENFQKVGAFKARGACNAVFSLDDAEARRGVATHSSGNHAAALARAAALRGIAAHIVMPNNSPRPKQNAVAGYGGRIVLCEPTLQARERTCEVVIAGTGATLIHPYNDYRIIAGQATVALELMEEVPELDIVLVPVGGGGLLSGTALAVKSLRPATKVLGAEPAQANDAAESLAAGRIVSKPVNTMADGLRTMLGELNFPIIRKHVDDIATVSEDGIAAAMRRLWEIMKIVVEPSGAVPYAAVREHGALFAGKRVGIVVSGGNVDLETLPWIKR